MGFTVIEMKNGLPFDLSETTKISIFAADDCDQVFADICLVLLHLKLKVQFKDSILRSEEIELGIDNHQNFQYFNINIL